MDAPSPYKAGPRSPLSQLVNGGNPRTIRIDIAHTWAIVGVGKDFFASCILFLAVHCRIWGDERFEAQLERAWKAFRQWCVENKRYTTITEFSKQELKIKSFLGQHPST